ncbi:hypothetical protein C8Q73DRAFT_838779, partial [Cubamyces lactineus]
VYIPSGCAGGPGLGRPGSSTHPHAPSNEPLALGLAAYHYHRQPALRVLRDVHRAASAIQRQRTTAAAPGQNALPPSSRAGALDALRGSHRSRSPRSEAQEHRAGHPVSPHPQIAYRLRVHHHLTVCAVFEVRHRSLSVHLVECHDERGSQPRILNLTESRFSPPEAVENSLYLLARVCVRHPTAPSLVCSLLR